MNTNDFYHIPKYLDEPIRILIWTPSEAAIIFGALFIGIITNHMMLGMMGSVLGFYFFKKNNGEGNYVLRWVYWNLPHFKGIYRWLPPSHIREYIG